METTEICGPAAMAGDAKLAVRMSESTINI
jgi:hypothetical protein